MNTKQESAMNKMTDRSGHGAVARATYGYRRDSRAFTLVELLIVIALSGLILALLFAPIIQGFHLTAKAKSLVQAQDASRNGLEQFSREASQASYVFDNSTTPITLPLEAIDTGSPDGAAAAPKRKQNGKPVYPTTADGYVVQPKEAFGRVDLISSDVVNPGTAATDPTTNTPVGGADLRVPIAPSGTRYVRYFIGLQTNTDATGTVEQYYQNLYEFHGSAADQDFNPFILYRAEYDPNDPNLIAQTTTGPVLTNTSGGFADPNFFYNVGAASTMNRSGLTGNGKSYALNWKAIASPVVTGHNLDMLIWRRNSNGGIDPNTAFSLGANFAPSSVVNDVATPGFLTNAQAEAPSALPTLYTSQFGAWTLPFTVNVMRGSTQRLGGITGSVSLNFGYGPAVNGAQSLLCTVTSATGSLASSATLPFYVTYSPTNGKYFVCLPSLTFLVDVSRGRIETGLPSFASANKGIPYYLNGTTPAPMTASSMVAGVNTEVISNGDLVPTIYRQSTLDHQDANQTVLNSANVASVIPANQGITFADLQGNIVSPGTDSVSQYGGYYLLSTLQTTIDVTPLSPYESPFRPNGLSTGFDGAMLVLGSERVVGPDNNLTTTTITNGNTKVTVPLLIDYNRVPSGPADLAKNNVGSAVSGSLYARNSPLNYQFDPRLQLTNEPIIEFDNHPANYDTTVANYQAFLIANLPAGLPTPATTSTANPAPPATEIQVSFLWQNNYARETVNTDELPVDANGNNQAQATTGTFQPEPDVFQVTYATRSLLNVGLSAHVYDIYSGQPVFAQVTNKIKVNNVGR